MDAGASPEITGSDTLGSSQQESNFTDGSGAIFTMYLEKTEKEDDRMTESWKGDADGILVFTGLFSATVATFLGMSIPDLTQNPQDTSAFYLAQLYQLSVINQLNNSSPIFLPPLSDPASFSPSLSSIWVNILWSMSLVISLTCALLATLLQQWARRYLRLTRASAVPHKRARRHMFLKEGVDKLYLPTIVDALPGMLHVSVFLFFTGLALFLFNANTSVYGAVLSCVSVCAGLYLCITLMPLFRDDSPYHTPLSSLVWRLVLVVAGIAIAIFLLLFHFLMLLSKAMPGHRARTKRGAKARGYAYNMLRGLVARFRWRNVAEAVTAAALRLHWEIDARAIQWLTRSFDEDHEFEKFIAGVPGFLGSKAVKDPAKVLLANASDPSRAIVKFMDRTLSSDLVTQGTKLRRGALCAKALEANPGLLARALGWTGLDLFSWTDFGVLASRHTEDHDPEVAFNARIITARFTAVIGRTDERWFPAMVRYLSVDEPTLRRYISHGDSLFLASLLRIVPGALTYDIGQYDIKALLNCSTDIPDHTFRIQDTLSELQHQFCEVWNGSVGFAEAQFSVETDDRRRHLSIMVLEHLRDFFEALHPELVQSTSLIPRDPLLRELPPYPRCTDPKHRNSCSRDNGAGRLPSAAAAPRQHPFPATLSPTAPQLSNDHVYDPMSFPYLATLPTPSPSNSQPSRPATCSAVLPQDHDPTLLGGPRPPPQASEYVVPIPRSTAAPRTTSLPANAGHNPVALISWEHAESPPRHQITTTQVTSPSSASTRDVLYVPLSEMIHAHQFEMRPHSTFPSPLLLTNYRSRRFASAA